MYIYISTYIYIKSTFYDKTQTLTWRIMQLDVIGPFRFAS